MMAFGFSALRLASLWPSRFVVSPAPGMMFAGDYELVFLLLAEETVVETGDPLPCWEGIPPLGEGSVSVERLHGAFLMMKKGKELTEEEEHVSKESPVIP